MLQKPRGRKAALAIAAIALAIAITTVAAACKPTTRWHPHVQTFSTECKSIAKGSYSRAKLESGICDLYEKVQRLEQRIDKLEAAAPAR